MPSEITEIFSDHYANVSRDPQKKNEPGKNRKRRKQKDQPYNKSFTDRELKTTEEYSPRKDTIHSYIIKRLPKETLK